MKETFVLQERKKRPVGRFLFHTDLFKISIRKDYFS